MFQPRALGVGYDIIEELLAGQYSVGSLAPLIVVKAAIWAIALGSGTSGGVLAPLLIMGGALGAIESSILPGGDRALWPLVSMAAALGGTMRSPFTAVVFALELTHDMNALPALLIAATMAHGFTVLVMKRSILTEKVARRGYHISREYATDPLERLTIGDVMATDVVIVPASMPIRDVMTQHFFGGGPHSHPGYPVVDRNGRLLGVITRSNFLENWSTALLDGEGAIGAGPIIAYDLIHRQAVVATPGESCRAAAERMAEAGVKRLPVVAADEPDRVVGVVSLSDLLKARRRILDEESTRERFLGPRRAAADPPAV
jgi:CBS domain-containing protein